jgi:hypothetical protein
MPAISELTTLPPEAIRGLQQELAACKALKTQFFQLVNNDDLLTTYFDFRRWTITPVSTGLRWTIVNEGVSIVSQNGASAFFEVCDRAYKYARITDFQVIEDNLCHSVMPSADDLWKVVTRSMEAR